MVDENSVMKCVAAGKTFHMVMLTLYTLQKNYILTNENNLKYSQIYLVFPIIRLQ